MLIDADYQIQAAFRYALRRFMHVSEENARAVGITPTQYLLLLTVRGHPSYPTVSIKDLAEYLQISPHTASLLVDRAVNRTVDEEPAPLVVRARVVEDRRRAMILLTAEGENLLTRVMSENRRVLAAFDGVFNDLGASLATRIRPRRSD